MSAQSLTNNSVLVGTDPLSQRTSIEQNKDDLQLIERVQRLFDRLQRAERWPLPSLPKPRVNPIIDLTQMQDTSLEEDNAEAGGIPSSEKKEKQKKKAGYCSLFIANIFFKLGKVLIEAIGKGIMLKLFLKNM